LLLRVKVDCDVVDETSHCPADGAFEAAHPSVVAIAAELLRCELRSWPTQRRSVHRVPELGGRNRVRTDRLDDPERPNVFQRPGSVWTKETDSHSTSVSQQSSLLALRRGITLGVRVFDFSRDIEECNVPTGITDEDTPAARDLTMLTSSRTLKVMEKKFTLKEFGPQLWTREKARPIRSRVGDALDGLKAGDVLAIDASGVEVFDFSFAAELFGKTLSTLGAEYPGRFLIVEGLTDCTRENLTQALEGSNALMIERSGGKLQLLGKVHPTDEATFRGILKAGEAVSAGTLSQKLEVNLTAMNERLSKLGSLGIVRREKSSSASGREQYVYKVMG